MSDETVHIFADESCLGNQYRGRRNPGAAAGMLEIFVQEEGWHRRDYAVFEPDTTNNRMALRSAVEGLGSLRHRCDVVFTSDSQYLIKGMKDWVHRWAERGWRRKGGPIENLDLWKAAVRVARRHRVRWEWVRGHDDHPKNEYAHMLATRAAETREGTGGLVPSGFDEWIHGEIDAGRFVDFLDLPPEGRFEPDPPPPNPG